MASRNQSMSPSCLHRPRQTQFGSPSRVATPLTPQPGALEQLRLAHYALDYPPTQEVPELLDPKLRFYGRVRPRTLNLQRSLPYATELPLDRLRYLGHIITHLYLAIKSLDIKGTVSVSLKDLERARSAAAIEGALDDTEFDSEDAEDDDDDDDKEKNESYEEDRFLEEYIEDDMTGDLLGGVSAGSHADALLLVSVRHWTRELRSWIKMKGDMPFSIRIALAKVYYDLCLAASKSDIQAFFSMFRLLVAYEPETLRSLGLILDPEPLLDLVIIPNKLLQQHVLLNSQVKTLLKVGDFAKDFFPNESFKLVWERVGRLLSPENLPKNLRRLTFLPPSSPDLLDSLPLLFHLWSVFVEYRGTGENIADIMANGFQTLLFEGERNGYAILERFGEYGFLDRDQMHFLLTQALQLLNVDSGVFGASASQGAAYPYSLILAYSVNGKHALSEGGLFHQIDTLLNSIETFLHPSNMEEGTANCLRFLGDLITCFRSRYILENDPNGKLKLLPENVKLCPEVVEQFVRMTLPKVLMGVQSKDRELVNENVEVLYLLCDMLPTIALNAVLVDVYESVQNLVSVHRLLVTLKVIQRLSCFFASTPALRVHVTTILNQLLPGIDPNDIPKTVLTLNAIGALATYVPFCDLLRTDPALKGTTLDVGLAVDFITQHMAYLSDRMTDDKDKFVFDHETERNALIALTGLFDDFLSIFTSRLFNLLENMPELSESLNTENTLQILLPRTMLLMFEAMDDSFFDSFGTKLLDFVGNNLSSLFLAIDVVSEIVGTVVKRCPSQATKYLEFFLKRTTAELEGGAGRLSGVKVLNSDKPLFCLLSLLAETVRHMGTPILQHGFALTNLLRSLFKEVRGPVMYGACELVTLVLRTLTIIRLEEQRLISPLYVKKHGITEACWGAFYRTKEKFEPENLDFKWHLPLRKEVEFAIQFAAEHVDVCCDSFDALLASGSNGSGFTDLADALRKHLLLLTDVTQGIAYLLDPEYPHTLGESSKSDKLNALLLDRRLRALNLSQRLLSRTATPERDSSRLATIGTLGSEESLDQFQDQLRLESVDTVAESTEMSREPSEASDRLLLPDELEVSNPQVTKRAQRVYTCRYFFGDSREERVHHELYRKIHGVHQRIGEKLLSVSKILVKDHPNDVKLIRTLLFAIQTWMCDVGAESFLRKYDDLNITYKLINYIQGLYNGKAGLTRVALGARLERYHRQRVLMHACARFQTRLDKELIAQLVRLLMSGYYAVSLFAQNTLEEALRKILGSYLVIISNVFERLEEILATGDIKSAESALAVFGISRLKLRLPTDYKNLKRYAQILLRFMDVDDERAHTLAMYYYSRILHQLKVPTLVSGLSDHAADVIRPPDSTVELDVRLLRKAKESKRKHYMSALAALQNFVLKTEESQNHWKVSSANLAILGALQRNAAMPSNLAAIEMFAKRAGEGHPYIAFSAVFGLIWTYRKTMYLAQLGGIQGLFDAKTPRSNKMVITTSYKKLGHSYKEDFAKEMDKRDNFSYGLQYRVTTGWLFWGEEMIAYKSKSDFEFSPHDVLVFAALNQFATPDWLRLIIKVGVEEREEDSSYHEDTALLAEVLIVMICKGYLTSLTLQDLMNVVDETYVRDLNATHLVTVEFLHGFLAAGRSTDVLERPEVREFFKKTVDRAMQDLAPENEHNWNVLFYLCCTESDFRRMGFIVDDVMRYLPHPGEEHPFKQTCRMEMKFASMVSLSWRYGHTNLKELIQLAAHPYQTVRNKIGAAIAYCLRVELSEQHASLESFLEAQKQAGSLGALPHVLPDSTMKLLRDFFEDVELERSQLPSKITLQEILETPYYYKARTALSFVSALGKSHYASVLGDLIGTHMSPFLLNLTSMRDVCKLASVYPNETYISFAQISYRREHIPGIVKMILENGGISEPLWHQRLTLLEFTVIFYFRQLCTLELLEKSQLFDHVTGLLFDRHLEVREAAAKALSGMIHCSASSERLDIVEKYTSKFGQILTKYRKLSLRHKKARLSKATKWSFSQEDGVQLHGATLGLGSLISAFPYLSPPPSWFSSIVELLSNNAYGLSGIVDKASKQILSSFKKTRQDTWHIDSLVFNESQLGDLEGLLREQYFV